MSIETQVVWTPSADVTAVKTRGEELMPLQVSPPFASINPSTGYATVSRYWVDEVSAVDWISFVEQYSPVTATIIS